MKLALLSWSAKVDGFRQAKTTLAKKVIGRLKCLSVCARFLIDNHTISYIPSMNGSQKHVDYTPLKPVNRSDEELAALEGCLWFDIGACSPGSARQQCQWAK